MLAPGFRSRRFASFVRFGALVALILFGLWTYSNRAPAPMIPIRQSAAEDSNPLP
ncbi:hypothetical protein F66182_9132, partial [Fusarium sp. NRRL 66182]